MTKQRSLTRSDVATGIDIGRVEVGEILRFRDLYRREMHCQIIHDSLHERGFTHSYLIRADGMVAGYGCVLGYGTDPKDIVREFFVLPPYVTRTAHLFERFVEACGATSIEAQTNDARLTSLLLRYASSVEREKILFSDGFTSELENPGVTFRRTTDADRRARSRTTDEMGDWVLTMGDQVVASGGVLFHYNVPYGDVHMEVESSFRRRGYGSFLVQELKRACYQMGRVPAARCDITNTASRATLEKAGMVPCAYLLKGTLHV